VGSGTRRFRVRDAGLEYRARYTKKTRATALLPLANRMKGLSGTRPGRTIVCLAGPPGSGKSTLAQTFVLLLERSGCSAAALPLDGFHLPNRELETRKTVIDGERVPLSTIKGAPETFDTARFLHYLTRLREGESFHWPAYSRKTHEPLDEGMYVDREAVIIVEGNWLLLAEEPWLSFRKFYDLSIFIVPMRRLLKRRIVRRKHRGGYSRKEARLHFDASDGKNICRAFDGSNGYDASLTQTGRYAYRLDTPPARSR
jgi:pantothenate kinase